jgi:cysteine desulfurase/selenocysteine lyase
VIDALVNYYSNYNANIHRGIHTLAEEATAAFELPATRCKPLSMHHPGRSYFHQRCTEGINLVAQTWGRQNIKAGDEVIVSNMEHHSNIVPWLCFARKKALR